MAQPTTKLFHIGDILSVTTGILVSPRKIEGVYDILNWMTGESLFTHALPRVADEAKPVLERALPWLKTISGKGIGKGNWQPWLAALELEHGSMHPIPKFSQGQHIQRGPLAEFEAATDGKPRVIVVTS